MADNDRPFRGSRAPFAEFAPAWAAALCRERVVRRRMLEECRFTGGFRGRAPGRRAGGSPGGLSVTMRLRRGLVCHILDKRTRGTTILKLPLLEATTRSAELFVLANHLLWEAALYFYGVL